MLFKQCTLAKGNIKEVSWIPWKFAKKNKPIKLKLNGNWEEGWIVEKVGENSVNEEYLLEFQNNYKNHRTITDI
jgi:hypothetical protein